MNLGVISIDQKKNVYHLIVTLKPELYKDNARHQLKVTMDKLAEILRYIVSEYYIVAELTKKVNVHYHVLIKFSKHVEYGPDVLIDSFKSRVNAKYFGNVLLNQHKTSTPEEYDKLWKYVNKELDRTNRVINKGRKNEYNIIDEWQWNLPEKEKVDLIDRRVKNQLNLNDYIEKLDLKENI